MPPVAVDAPGCLTVAEMGKKATKNKQVFLVDLQTRTERFHKESIKRVQEGTIGKIGMISSHYYDDGFDDPPLEKTIEPRLKNLIWTNDYELGGSYIVNCDIHAIDVALWTAGSIPVSAMGSARTARIDPHGGSADIYSVTYHFADGLVVNHHSEHIKNSSGFVCSCTAHGQTGYMEARYGGKTWVYGGKRPYRGGAVQNLYYNGIIRNLETFHKSIVKGAYDNPTVQPSVNSTLASILGREAARSNSMLTWNDMIKQNKKLNLDLSGLKP